MPGELVGRELARGETESIRREPGAALLESCFLTVQQAAKRLNVSVTTMHKWVKHEPGVLRVVDGLGRRALIRIPADVLERIIRRNTILSRPPR